MKHIFILHLMFSIVLYSQSSIPINNKWQIDGIIRSIVVDSTYTYIGGSFSYIGPYTGGGVRVSGNSLLADSSFAKVEGYIGVVVPDGNGGWYVAGEFSKVGGEIRNYIARINRDGTLHPWNPNPNNYITCIATDGDYVYIGGAFTNVSGQSRSYLAKVNSSDGTIAPDWNPNPNGTINNISIKDNYIYACGDFTSIGGQIRNYIAKLNNINGKAIQEWNPNPNNIVMKIATSDSNVFVSGYFTKMNGKIKHYIAKLDTIDGTFSNWDPHLIRPTKLIAIDSTNIYMYGEFSGYTSPRLVRATTVDPKFVMNLPIEGQVNSINIKENDLYLGGSLLSLGSQFLSGLVRLNKNHGQILKTYYVGPVRAIGINTTEVYIGGSFRSVGGISVRNLCRINNLSDSLDVTWQPAPNGEVYTIVLNGKDIYIGGNFSSVGGMNTKNLAKLNYTFGTADALWRPDPNNIVKSLAIKDGFVYVGGLFNNIYEEERYYLARVSISDGSLDYNWEPQIHNITKCLLINDNVLYAGGEGLYKLNLLDGKTEMEWKLSSGGFINTLAIYNDDIYVGGKFTALGVYKITNLAKISKSTGAIDNLWNPTIKNEVYALAFYNDNLYVGGSFGSIFEEYFTCLLSKLTLANGEIDPFWKPNPNVNLGSGPYPEVYVITSYKNKLFAGGHFNYMSDLFTGNYAIFYQPDVIPVELTTFTGNVSNSIVNLSWTTATETNNRGFEIERKSEFSLWESIAFINGFGTTTEPKNYSFSDSTFITKKIYSDKFCYRLKQIDFDGTYSYSQIFNAKLTIPHNYSLKQNYPNPFNPSTTIKFEIANTEKVILKIYNILGCEVKTLINEIKPAGTYELNFNAFDLASGVYFYKMEAGIFSDTKKLVILR